MSRNGEGSLLTRRELADELDQHPQTIVKWKDAGIPIAKQGGRGVPHLYDLDAVREWLRQREEAREAGEPIDLQAERARKERAQARLAEQKYLERARKLLPAEEVAEVWSAHINAARTKILNWPATLRDRMYRAAKRGPAAVEQELRAAVREVLTELAEGDLEEDRELEQVCGAPTSAGTPCRNTAKKDGRCHIPSHQKA